MEEEHLACACAHHRHCGDARTGRRWAAIQCANGKSLAETAWSLLPPVIAIVLALVSKEAYSSLFIGVVVGALFTTNFAPVAALDAVVNDGLIAAIADNAGIFLFLVLLGIIVALVNAAGGSAAFGRWAETHIKNARRRAVCNVHPRRSHFHRRLF